MSRNNYLGGLSFWVVIAAAFSTTHQVIAAEGGTSRSLLRDLDLMDISKQQYEAGDPVVTRDVRTLIAQANVKLSEGPYSVVFSEAVAPSGDPHDYVSYASYWWPNPDTPDGIPWIARDGHVNPANVVDNGAMCKLGRAAEPLSLAYFFTGDEKYAEKAASLIRVWFLDEETYMNPRNEYATLRPRNDGSFYAGTYNVPGFGNCIPATIDAAAILEGSPHWTTEDEAGLKKWVSDFINWSDVSPIAARQFNEPSNHGTNYDFVEALFALYIDDEDVARESMNHYLHDRMPGQMAEDGSNPLEMQRADNMLYHRYNLGRANDLAWLSRHVEDVDMFGYEMEDGRSLRLGLDFLLPYFLGETWDQFPGETFRMEPWFYYEMLREAAVYYQDPLLLDAADSLGYTSREYVNLTHPRDAVLEKLPGDFNTDGVLSAADLDLMAERMGSQNFFARYDLDGTGTVDLADRRIWVEDMHMTTFGDSDLDGQFDSSDLVDALIAGKYRTGEDALWSEGDWTGDRRFDDSDIVLAFISGGYNRSAGLQQVPEPAGATLICLSLLAVTVFRPRGHSL